MPATMKLSRGRATGVHTICMEAKGQTLYEKVAESKYLPGPGPEES
jgi:hypothetical protein